MIIMCHITNVNDESVRDININIIKKLEPMNRKVSYNKLIFPFISFHFKNNILKRSLKMRQFLFLFFHSISLYQVSKNLKIDSN